MCSSVSDVSLLLAVRVHHHFGKILGWLVCAPWKTGVRFCANDDILETRSRYRSLVHTGRLRVDTTSGLPRLELIFSNAKLVRGTRNWTLVGFTSVEMQEIDLVRRTARVGLPRTSVLIFDTMRA